MAALHALVRGMFDAQTGVVAALLYAIFVAWADYTNLALNGELLMNLPVVLAFLGAAHPPGESSSRAPCFRRFGGGRVPVEATLGRRGCPARGLCASS